LTNSCIDHIIFIRDNHKHYNIHSAVIDSLITDHCPLFLQLNHTAPQQTKNSNNNSYKFVNFRELKKAINRTDRGELITSKHAEKKLRLLTSIIKTNLNNNTHHGTKSNNYQRNQWMWITPGIICAIKKGINYMF